jgi:ClpP class serine protease
VLAGRTRFETDPVKKKDLSERIKAVADGRIVSGEQALKAGLVDAIGDIYAAREKLDAMAKERFHISGKDQLPLEEYSESSGLLSLLGLSSLADHLMPKAKSHPAVEILGGLMPFSAQHPNQPLWIVE